MKIAGIDLEGEKLEEAKILLGSMALMRMGFVSLLEVIEDLNGIKHLSRHETTKIMIEHMPTFKEIS